MMRCEFEQLIGHEITCEEYEKVEAVYMAWDYKEMTKEKIADLYKHDRNFITETLYNYIIQHSGRNVEYLQAENDRKDRQIERIKKVKNDYSNIVDEQLKEIEKLEIDNAFCRKMVGEYSIKFDEYEMQLLQYRTHINDLIKTIQKNICKDFCLNVEPVTE